MALLVYGIPTCGTCKKALAWLNQAELAYEFVNTKLTPPDHGTISAWVKCLGLKPMINTSGQAYRSLGSERQTWTEAQWVDAFAQNPMLLKRPLFVKDGEAVMVGFRNPSELLQVGLDGN
ncbi:MAG: arsenate reductase family protein [Nodosilinea sp.]